MPSRLAGLSALIGAAALIPAARAEEGMWTFDNFPAARMRAEQGWAPDRPWLDRAMGATALIESGCSGGAVSGEGLVLTNHHCVLACFADPQGERDRFAEGFVARAREEELACPGLAVRVLTRITDVTERVGAAVADAAPESFAQARDAALADITRACNDEAAGARCDVVTLYQGARYALYEYRRFTDVRLAFAPEAGAAYFGGDADNFNFPRYCLDFALLRLYENGKPASTPRHLSLRAAPLAEGEVALVAGNPGRTARLSTAAQLTFERDQFLPWRIDYFADWKQRLAAYAARGEHEARLAADLMLNVDDALKSYRGMHAALSDPESFARAEAAETDLKARVRRNRAAQRAVGDAWNEVARAQDAYAAFFKAHNSLEQRFGAGSALLLQARAVARGAAAPESLDALAFDPAFEQASIGFWLERVANDLGPAHVSARAVLGGETPEALAARLVAETLAHRESPGGGEHPLVAWLRRWDGEAFALHARYERDVEGPVESAQERIGQARFRAFGESAYPDATFSPRLSYGAVAGWSEADGAAVAPFTDFAGLYARAAADASLALGPAWNAARPALDPATQLNFVTTNDTVGGNSGSPLLDRQGRLAGVVFDVNAPALGGTYFYDGARNRTIALAAPAIGAALTKVYGATELAAELGLR